MYNIVIHHLYILGCDPHDKSSSHLSRTSYYDIIDCVLCAVHYPSDLLIL